MGEGEQRSSKDEGSVQTDRQEPSSPSPLNTGQSFPLPSSSPKLRSVRRGVWVGRRASRRTPWRPADGGPPGYRARVTKRNLITGGTARQDRSTSCCCSQCPFLMLCPGDVPCCMCCMLLSQHLTSRPLLLHRRLTPPPC